MAELRVKPRQSWLLTSGWLVCVSETVIILKFPQIFLLLCLMNSPRAFSPIRESLCTWKCKPLELLVTKHEVNFHSHKKIDWGFAHLHWVCRHSWQLGPSFCHLSECSFLGILVSEVVPHWLLRPGMWPQAWDVTVEGVTEAGNATEHNKQPESPASSSSSVFFCSYKLHLLPPSNFPILNPKPTIWWALNYQCLFSWVRALKPLLLAWKRGHPTVSTICSNTFTFFPFYPLGWKVADNNLVACHVPV